MSEPREQRLRDSLVATQIALDSLQARLRTAMPGFIESVDLDANTCSVQPAIQGVITKPDGSEQLVNLPLLVDVPIAWPRCGRFALTLPLEQGDEVLVVFGDRCIDGWWQQGTIAAPAEERMHDLSDAFAIPGPASQRKKLPNVSSTSAQLRNAAGETYVEIDDDGRVRIIATGDVEVQTKGKVAVQADGDVTVEAKGNVTAEATGNAEVTATGTATIKGAAIILDANNTPIDWLTHTHGGVALDV